MEPVYVPSLHHISVEIEDGQSVDGKRLNYNFDLNMFPSFSWKGYVQFSLQQVTVCLFALFLQWGLWVIEIMSSCSELNFEVADHDFYLGR